MSPIQGKLEAFSETGTEGIIWCVIDDALSGWDKLNCLKDGDHLTILDPDTKSVVWEGKIHLEYERNITPSGYNPNYKKQAIHGMWVNGIQDNVLPELWANWFFKEYPVILNKKEFMTDMSPWPWPKSPPETVEPKKTKKEFPTGPRPE